MVRSIALISLLLANAALAAPKDNISLPELKADSASLDTALRQRRTTRTLSQAPLTLEQIGQLCFAAQGVSEPGGHRTTPSAHATYPLELYVMVGAVTGLAPGLYRYEPAEHRLERLLSEDLRKKLTDEAVGQGWITDAPAFFVLTGQTSRMKKVGDRAADYMWVEAGAAAQNFFLKVAALGLGSAFIGGFEPIKARSILNFAANEEVLAILPVGHKK